MTTEDCEAAVLQHLSSSPDAVIEDTFPWAAEKQLDHLKVVGAIKSLMADDYVRSSDLATSFYELSKEAETILANGSQEILVLQAIAAVEKMSLGDLQTAVGKDVAKIGMGNCMRSKWVKKDGADLVAIVKPEEVSDETQAALQKLSTAGCAEDAIDDKVRFVHVRSRRWTHLTAFTDQQRPQTTKVDQFEDAQVAPCHSRRGLLAGTCQKGSGSHQRNARLGRMEDASVQAVQLCDSGRTCRRRLLASTSQGPG